MAAASSIGGRGGAITIVEGWERGVVVREGDEKKGKRAKTAEVMRGSAPAKPNTAIPVEFPKRETKPPAPIVK